jgi:pilus assembly protein CpaE
MKSPQVRIGIVSSDEQLKVLVQQAIDGAKTPARIPLEIDRCPSDLEVTELQRIRSADLHVLVLDMSEDPRGVVRVAGAMGAEGTRTALVGIGPDLDASLLLEAMRAGLVEYVPHPTDPNAVYEALGRALHKKGGVPEEVVPDDDGTVLAFFSAKGGAGSTTVATNVGIELHRLSGQRTLLVDLDLEMGEIASMLGIQPRFHFVDLVRNFHRMDADLLASYIESHDSGVHVLSAPFEPEVGESVTQEQIATILGFLRSHYDYVVVDMSKSLAPPAMATLRAADSIFLITNVDVPSIRNLKRALPSLDQATGGDVDRLRLVVNRFNGKGLVGLKDLEETLGLEVYATLGNDYKTVIEAMSTGRPLVLNGGSRYGSQIRELAEDIIDGFADEGAGTARKSLVERILSPFRSDKSGDTRELEPVAAELPAHG